MLKEKDLVKALEKEQGFNIEYEEGGNNFTIGVRYCEMMDIGIILVGGYSMGLKAYNLNEHDTCESIAKDIMDIYAIDELLKFIPTSE